MVRKERKKEKLLNQNNELIQWTNWGYREIQHRNLIYLLTRTSSTNKETKFDPIISQTTTQRERNQMTH